MEICEADACLWLSASQLSRIVSGKQLGENATAAMLQNIQTTAQEQQQELYILDNVTALVMEQIGKVMLLDGETTANNSSS